MNILYFSQNYTIHDRHFLLKLAQSGHKIHFLRIQNEGILHEKCPIPMNIEQLILNQECSKKFASMPLLSYMPSFESVINEIKPDLIHAGPVQSCGFMTAIMDFHPFIIMSWGSDILVDTDKDKTHNWMTRYALSRSDMLVCDSNAVRDKVQQLIPYEEERIVQFPWGVKLSEFQEHRITFDWRTHLGWNDKIIVISTRSWENIYGINTVLNAFHRAYSKNPRLRMILVGSGSLEKEIKDHIRISCLGDVIFLAGRVDHYQMADYLNAADIYISASLSDGSSVSLLEAMAVGLPVIASDIPGNREWIIADRNGWLIPPGNFEEFSKSILRAANLSKEKVQQIYRFNRKIVNERANWDKNSEKILKAYNELTGKMGAKHKVIQH